MSASLRVPRAGVDVATDDEATEVARRRTAARNVFEARLAEMVRENPTRPFTIALEYDAMMARAGVFASFWASGLGSQYYLPIPAVGPMSPYLPAAIDVLIGANGMLGIGLPQILSDPTAEWRNEIEAAPQTITELNARRVTDAPRHLAVATAYSRQMQWTLRSPEEWGSRRESNALIDSAIRSLRRTLARGLVAGSGGDEPDGILGSADVAEASSPQEALEIIGDADAPAEESEWLVSPSVRRLWQESPTYTGATVPLWSATNTVCGVAARASSAVPKTETPTSSAILGRWADALIWLMGTGVDLVIDPYSKRLQSMIEVSAMLHGGFVLTRPTSFAKILDIAV